MRHIRKSRITKKIKMKTVSRNNDKEIMQEKLDIYIEDA